MSGVQRGYDRSFGGLTGAIVAALLLIGAVFLFTRLPAGDEPDGPPTVEYERILEFARAEAPFDVLAPASVPAGWRATTVSFKTTADADNWHLGFLVDEREYVAVDQSTAEPDDVLAGASPARGEDEPVQVDGAMWDVYTDGDDDHALVRTEGDVTTIVAGTTGTDVLVRFAESLQP